MYEPKLEGHLARGWQDISNTDRCFLQQTFHCEGYKDAMDQPGRECHQTPPKNAKGCAPMIHKCINSYLFSSNFCFFKITTL